MSVNFPTCVKPRLEITHIKAHVFFLVPVTPSASEPARLSDGCSAHCHQVHPVSLSVSLQASWVKRKVDLLHAGCGNRDTHAKHAHAAETVVECLAHPVPIKGHMETCERKKMEKESFSFSTVECMTCPLRVCLLSPPLTAFLSKP